MHINLLPYFLLKINDSIYITHQTVNTNEMQISFFSHVVNLLMFLNSYAPGCILSPERVFLVGQWVKELTLPQLQLSLWL